MNTLLEIILILLVLGMIIFENIFVFKKSKDESYDELFISVKKLVMIMYSLAIFVFLFAFIYNFTILTEINLKNIWQIMVKAFTIAIILMPLLIKFLYSISIKDAEKYSHIKTVVTNLYEPQKIKKLNRAGINVIVLTNKTIDSKIKVITEDEINKKILQHNLIIKTNKHNILKKYFKENLVAYEFDNLDNILKLVYTSRGIHDNYIRTLKYNVISYVPLLICYCAFIIADFPVGYNLLLVCFLKAYIILSSIFVYKKMPYDTDIMERKPKPLKVLMGGQEWFICLIEALGISFSLSLPYMYVLSHGASQALANTLFLIIYIFSNVFVTISLLSENNFLKNMIKFLQNKYLLFYFVISVGITLLFNFTRFFETRNIEWQNYLSAVFFALIPVFILELTKFARFTTIRKSGKNESKNN